MADFHIRSYTKKELAVRYFPDTVDPHCAVNHLMRWINRNEPMRNALVEAGYRKQDKYFTPRQVRIIAYFLGEP